ncbi:MAG: AEC family transporter [Bacteriovorax sp.]|nr:AEC family transporter [Rhizobacter sp.]
MLHILEITFPFFALVLCGYGVARCGWLPLESIPGLNLFVLFFALPCLLFRFGAVTPIARMLDPSIFGTYLLCALLMVGISVATTRRGPMGWNDASFGALVAAFPNSGFMGVPLLVGLLGERAAAPAIVALAVDMVITSSLCIALSRLGTSTTTTGSGRAHGSVRAVLNAQKGMATNPLPWSIGLGCLVSASGVNVPTVLMKPVGMLADAASPVALFALGAMLARSSMRAAAAALASASASASTSTAAGPRRSDVPQIVLYKLVVHPALVLGAGRLAIAAGVPLDGFAATVLTLVAALPSASNVPMLAERFGADAGRIARIVLVSTALAFLSFSAAVALLA